MRRTLDVLRAVASSAQGVGLSEVARLSAVPKATCHRILQQLEDEGLIALDPVTKRYSVSLGVLSLLSGILTHESLHVVSTRELAELSRDTQETAGLDVSNDVGVTVVLQVQGPHLISQAAKPVPRTLPEWCASTGKVFNAWRDPDEAARRLRQVAPAERVDDLIAELATIRSRGYATAYNEVEVGAAAIGAPVFVNGQVEAAVWIGGPTYRITTDRMPELAERVFATATRLSWLFQLQGGQPVPGKD